MKNKKIVEIKNLSFNYHTKTEETQAISNMTFDVFENEFLTILGPSGCGKSTVLSIISNLKSPSGGEVIINSPEKGDSEQSIGYMFQQDCLFEWKSILENVLLGLNVKHIADEKQIAYAEKLLERYGLGDFKNYYPCQLSGGMRQKAALIRTLALRPQILLLDEPFSALDYQTRITISEEVKKIILKEGKTAILVSHDISEAISISDRIIVFSKRPSSVKRIININPDFKNLTRLEKQKDPKFNEYFEIIWSDLNE